MIIPVRCFTCGKCISKKYEEYVKLITERKEKEQYKNNQDSRINNDDIFKKLKLKRYCCRRMCLTHVDLLEILKPN